LMERIRRLNIKLIENRESEEELVRTSESYRVAIARLHAIEENTLNFMVKEFVQAVHAHKIHRSKE